MMIPFRTLWYGMVLALVAMGLMLGLAACDSENEPVPPTATPEPPTVTLRNWEGDLWPELFEPLTAATGIRVELVGYESQEEVVDEMRAGEAFDIVVLENQLIPGLVADGLLAELDYANIPNFKNISANFRNLAYDPDNRHAIPYSWGTTGLVVRTDLVDEPVTRWADLWRDDVRGKVLLWPLSRYVIGLALKAQGYSLNSENPDEINTALEALIELRPDVQLVEWEPAVAAPYLISGEVIVAMGQADDVTAGQEENPAIEYVMPEEGGLLWGDNFTIPANAPHKAAAEQVINFLLTGEVSAAIINETYYWLPNDAALPLVAQEIRDNPAIFPTSELLEHAEVMMAISPEAEALYNDAWAAFLAVNEGE